jgi:hypothetical protein
MHVCLECASFLACASASHIILFPKTRLTPNKFPSDEASLEAMILDPQPLSELEALLVGYQ